MLWRAALVVLAGLLTYANGVANPFLFDDDAAIVQNASITAVASALAPPANTAVAGRPLVNVTFALNYRAGGLDPSGYRVVNLGVHVACALLVFGIVRRTLQRAYAAAPAPIDLRDLACATALLFAVHPLTSEVVDYVTQRTEGLMALCYLLTVYAAIRAHGAAHARRWRSVAVAACLAGALCKETIATAPLAVLLWDRAFVYASFGAALRARRGLYAGLAVTWLVLGAMLAFGGQSLTGGFSTARLSWWTYFLNQPRMIVRYLRLTVWPGPLVIYYGWPAAVTLPDAWPWLLAVSALFAGTFLLFVRRPALAFPAAWVFLTLGPTSSVITIATEVAAERRMYLPLAGVLAGGVVALAAVVARRQRRAARPILAGALAVAVAALAVRTTLRNAEYSSPLRMARTVLDRWPNANAEYLVGAELVAAGRTREAIPHLRAAVDGYPPARYVLGTALLDTGETQEGIAALERFARDEPLGLPSRSAHGRLANTYAGAGNFAAALPHYREYLAAYGGDGAAWTGLAIAQVETGARHDALESFRRAAAAEPANARFQLNLARALLERGDADEARRIAARHPHDPAAHDILGRIHLQRGDVRAASAAFARALQLDPAYAPAREALQALVRRD